jgi:hypothetical protein
MMADGPRAAREAEREPGPDALVPSAAEAEAELAAHIASWEFAFAHAGGCDGGASHPRHEATRRRTEALRERLARARSDSIPDPGS